MTDMLCGVMPLVLIFAHWYNAFSVPLVQLSVT